MFNSQLSNFIFLIMQKKYLLYIDILGFANLVSKKPKEVKKIYEVVNELNVHRQSEFKAIIFSDTILIYNKYNNID